MAISPSFPDPHRVDSFSSEKIHGKEPTLRQPEPNDLPPKGGKPAVLSPEHQKIVQASYANVITGFKVDSSSFQKIIQSLFGKKT